LKNEVSAYGKFNLKSEICNLKSFWEVHVRLKVDSLEISENSPALQRRVDIPEWTRPGGTPERIAGLSAVPIGTATFFAMFSRH
jgi:hypothetical protein